MKSQPSALQYALPLIIAIAVVGGFTAWKVSNAKSTIGVSEAPTEASVTADAGQARWLKGQVHAHTGKSGDCTEPVDSVLAYYADAGFDFVVMTDHNHVTVANGPPGLLAISGAEITLNRESCDPMPPGQTACAMHMNALFADPAKANEAFFEPTSGNVFDAYKTELQTAKQIGALAQLNHPNYRYTAADPELLVKLSKEGLRFIEVLNEAKDVNADGDETHPNVEALWDQALIKGAKLYATGSDDAHNYSDAETFRAQGRNPAIVNQGFIYVWAKKEPGSIREAMERGEFYASTGVRVTYECDRGPGGALYLGCRLRVDGAHASPVIRWISNGKVIEEVNGHESRIHIDTPFADGPLTKKPVYWRAVVEAEGKRALTQPIFAAEYLPGP